MANTESLSVLWRTNLEAWIYDLLPVPALRSAPHGSQTPLSRLWNKLQMPPPRISSPFFLPSENHQEIAVEEFGQIQWYTGECTGNRTVMVQKA